MGAKTVERLHGDEVDELELGGFEPVVEVKGLADTWWKGSRSYMSIYRGESLAAAGAGGRHTPASRALIYSGTPGWA